MAKAINAATGKDINSEVIISLPKVQHESLQQEVYTFNNKSLTGYKSEAIFQVSVYNSKYTFKIAP